MLSMTGYASIERQAGDLRITLEIKSLNSKSLDLKVSCPRQYAALEVPILARLREHFSRGRVDVAFSAVDSGAIQVDCTAQVGVVRKYLTVLKQVSAELNLPGTVDLSHLLAFEEVTRELRPPRDHQQDWQVIEPLLTAAISEVDSMRKREGDALLIEFSKRLQLLDANIRRIEALVPVAEQVARDTLRKRLQALALEIPAERFEQEVVLALGKIDVTEEIVRIKAHLTEFSRILTAAGTEKGKRLGFLVQELQREVNTLGAKANAVDISSLVIDSKCELEKVREQLQNVE